MCESRVVNERATLAVPWWHQAARNAVVLGKCLGPMIKVEQTWRMTGTNCKLGGSTSSAVFPRKSASLGLGESVTCSIKRLQAKARRLRFNLKANPMNSRSGYAQSMPILVRRSRTLANGKSASPVRRTFCPRRWSCFQPSSARTIGLAQVDEPRQERQRPANAMRARSHNSPTLCLLPIRRARRAIMAGVIRPV